MTKTLIRIIFFYACFFILFFNAKAQNKNAANESLKDSVKVNELLKLSKDNFSEAPEKSITYATEAIKISEKIQYDKGKALGLKNIGIAYYYQGNYVSALNFWEQSLATFEKMNDEIGVSNLLNNIGAVYFNRGDDAKALDYYLRSLKLAEHSKDKLRILTAMNNIGGVYFNKTATHDKALFYFLKALPLSEELKDSEAIGTASVNLGEIYYARNQDSLALFYYNKSLTAFNNSESTPYSYNAIGKVYTRQKKFLLAIDYHNKAVAIATKLNGEFYIVQSYIGLANVYAASKNFKGAIEYFTKADAKASKYPYEQKNIYLGLSKLYNQQGNFRQAYVYQEKYANVKDTLYNIETDKKLGSLQFDFEITKKQGEINLLTKDKELQEVDLKRQKFAKNAFLVGLFLILIIALITFRNYLRKVKTNKILDKQKGEIEGLLLNILPSEVAKELQTTGRALPKHYDKVSVLFSDFKGFTSHAEKMSPQELVEELNACFVAFDNIVGKYNLEKIKTIGDSYMCAGGIPVEKEGHVLNIVKASLEMQEWIKDNNIHKANNGLAPWDLRIGIHVGPIVAGVVGKKKYAYDIWGSTVNIASRMESNGEAGKVNVSASTYELIKDQYHCSHRGKIHAKNVGDIDMYFIDREN